jgi:hypothetical protein
LTGAVVVIDRMTEGESMALHQPGFTLVAQETEANLHLFRRQYRGRLNLVYRNELGRIDSCVA